MKVIFIDFSLDKLGGVERVISTLTNELVNKYDIEICSVYKHSDQPFYKYNEKIRFNYLIDNSQLLSTKSNTKYGFYFFRIFEKIFELTFYKRRINRFCKLNLVDVDVVIFCRTTVAMVFLPYMDNFNGKIIVRDANHIKHATTQHRDCMKKYFPHRVDTFIVSSNESKELYRKFFDDLDINITKLYNPLGIVPKCCNPLKNKRIIGVGRYCREKGFENLILAYSQVNQKHPDWTLSLIGSGEDLARYKRMCKELEINDKVEFKRSTDIVEEYCNAGIFVMSSRGEGYANALVEALACGVPAITYNWYLGSDEIIEDEFSGLVVRLKDRETYFRTNEIDRGDVKHLADAINRLIEDEELRVELSGNAVKIIETRECSKVVSDWIKIIEGTS